MSRWLRPAGITLLLVGVSALGIGVVALVERHDTTGGATTPVGVTLAAARPGVAPFTGMTATRVVVGKRVLHVVVADSEAERGRGLRRRHTIGRYDGMLFVYASATTATFTMSMVPVPLDIAFYDGDGRVVRRLRMEPCAGTDATCPGYPSRGRIRFALETLAGDLPRGPLRSSG